MSEGYKANLLGQQHSFVVGYDKTVESARLTREAS
jgi:hypothetical protein